MRRGIFIFLFFIMLATVQAEVGSTITRTDTLKGENDKDTVPVPRQQEDDSLAYFPSHELYGEWDTTDIHFAKLSLADLNSIHEEIILCDENSCGYAHPFFGKVTSDFGVRKRKFHYGIDIDLETGDQVGAAFDGKVRIAKQSKSYGNIIVIRHDNGLETYYAHLSKINVAVGDEVYAGQNIGLGGNTGKSRGSHLHFEIRYLGKPINPNEIISFNEQKLVLDTLCISKSTFSYYTNYKLNNRIYVVKRGDTLSLIARKYGTSVKSLTKKNKLRTTSTLRLGQRIII